MGNVFWYGVVMEKLDRFGSANVRLASEKRARGRYYTRANPFSLLPFLEWAAEIGLSAETILEPFAGRNDLIEMLRAKGLCSSSYSYDINPASAEVAKRDTIADFPRGFSVCVTNPPWLARNSATRRGLPYPGGDFDNLYKRCLHLCLRSCDYVAALLPASFLQSGLFLDRLNRYILLHCLPFVDTENPVCLALFNPVGGDGLIYHDNEFVGDLKRLRRHLPNRRGQSRGCKFNDPDGDLGFVSFDDTRTPSIRFCSGEETGEYQIKQSSRFISRVSGDFTVSASLIDNLNGMVREFRHATNDVFLTPFKGLRRDGQYRRRMDFSLAKDFLSAA